MVLLQPQPSSSALGAVLPVRLLERRPRVKRSAFGPLIALIEQGVFAGSNFLFVVLLGRALPAAEYGAFSIGFSLLLLQAGMFTALVLEPLPVLGYVSPSKVDGAYLHFFRRAGYAVSGGIASLLLGASWFIAPPTRSALLSTAVAAPLILRFWSCRWFRYAQGSPASALRHTVAYAGVLLTGVALGWSGEWLNAWRSILLMGVAGLAAGILTVQADVVESDGERRSIGDGFWAEHWRYGRWILAASVCYWVTLQGQYIILGAIAGAEAAGGLRAMQNLAQPIEQVSTALGLWFLPRVSESVRERDWEGAGRALRRLTRILVVGGGVYLGMCWLLAGPLVSLLYGGRFLTLRWIVPVIVAVPLIMSASRGAQLASRALQRPSILLKGYAGSAVVALIAGPALIPLGGVGGAALAMLLAAGTFTLLLGFFVNREAKWLSRI